MGHEASVIKLDTILGLKITLISKLIHYFRMDNLQLKSLCIKLRNYNVKRKGLLGIKFSSTLEDIGIFDTNFVETVEYNFNIKSQINFASRAVIDNMGMKNINISLKFKKSF